MANKEVTPSVVLMDKKDITDKLNTVLFGDYQEIRLCGRGTRTTCESFEVIQDFNHRDIIQAEGYTNKVKAAFPECFVSVTDIELRTGIVRHIHVRP